MKEVGIEVVVKDKLPQVDDAFNEFVRDKKKARSADKVRPTAEQIGVEKMFPAIAKDFDQFGQDDQGRSSLRT